MDWLKECAEITGWISLGALVISGLVFWLYIIYAAFFAGGDYRSGDLAPTRPKEVA